MTNADLKHLSTAELLRIFHELQDELHRRYELGVISGHYPEISFQPNDKPRWPASNPPTDPERLAQWMAFNGFHTGQADSTQELLTELSAQIKAFIPKHSHSHASHT